MKGASKVVILILVLLMHWLWVSRVASHWTSPFMFFTMFWSMAIIGAFPLRRKLHHRISRAGFVCVSAIGFFLSLLAYFSSWLIVRDHAFDILVAEISRRPKNFLLGCLFVGTQLGGWLFAPLVVFVLLKCNLRSGVRSMWRALK